MGHHVQCSSICTVCTLVAAAAAAAVYASASAAWHQQSTLLCIYAIRAQATSLSVLIRSCDTLKRYNLCSEVFYLHLSNAIAHSCIHIFTHYLQFLRVFLISGSSLGSYFAGLLKIDGKLYSKWPKYATAI